MEDTGDVTMMDVARRAGVALSTVSHVVNRTRAVHPRTRAAVEDAIAATGYVPNKLARTLARNGGRTQTIGLALSAVSNPYFIDLVQAIVAGFAQRGLLAFIADTGENQERELAVVRSFHHHRVDGIFLAPAGTRARSPALDYLRMARVPSVLVDRLVSTEFSQTGCDNERGIRLLHDHLRALGHRNIGIVAGQPDISTTLQRLNAFRALSDAPDDLIVSGSTDVAAARAASARMLAYRPRPTAIVAGNNHSMIGLMQAIRDAGLRVPEDIAVVGFDDFEWADCFHPRLTVVRQPVEEIAAAALDLMDRAIEDRSAPPVSRIFQPTLVIRESCGALRAPIAAERLMEVARLPL